VEMRTADTTWQTEATGAEASLVERLEAQVEALNRKVGRLERRQQRFADMIRLLLALHDQTASRLTALDGGEVSDSLEGLDEVSRQTPPSPRAPRRRVAARRTDG
jgi:hypothetical protein